MTWKSRRFRLRLAALGVGTTSSSDAPTDVVPLLQTSHGKQQTVTQEWLGNGPCSHFQQESSPWAAFSLGASKLVP